MHAIGVQKSRGLSYAECATIATMNLRSYQSRVLLPIRFGGIQTMTVRRSIYALVVILILLVAYVLLVR